MRSLPRLRIRYTTWPRPAIELTDTPRPRCPDCDGEGEVEWGAPGREEPNYVDCPCWQPFRSWLLLPVPRWLLGLFESRKPDNREEPLRGDGPPF